MNKKQLPDHEISSLKKIKQVIQEFDDFLGILYFKETMGTSIKEDTLINILIDVRSKLRAEKQWALADLIRDKLDEVGVELKDQPNKTTWTRKVS